MIVTRGKVASAKAWSRAAENVAEFGAFGTNARPGGMLPSDTYGPAHESFVSQFLGSYLAYCARIISLNQFQEAFMGAIGPWRSFRDLERWVRNLESSLPRALDGDGFAADHFGLPAIESFVKDGTLVVRADVPGISPKDIEVSLLGDVLTIRGER